MLVPEQLWQRRVLAEDDAKGLDYYLKETMMNDVGQVQTYVLVGNTERDLWCCINAASAFPLSKVSNGRAPCANVEMKRKADRLGIFFEAGG